MSRLGPVIETHFQGSWKHKRIDQEIEAPQKKYDNYSRARKDPANKRWSGHANHIQTAYKPQGDRNADSCQPITDIKR